MSVLEEIYAAINDRAQEYNPLITRELETMHDNFYTDYVEANTSNVAMWDAFLDCLENERRTAFKVGFKAALELFSEGLTR